MLELVKNSAINRGGFVPDEYAKWFATRLRDAMLHSNMTQADLLDLLKQNGFEMTQQRLSHYMTGRNYPDPPVIKELVKALGISADWWLGLTEQSLPAADLDEMANAAKGEARINKTMKRLPKDEQQQVLQFAEFLLLRTTKSSGMGGNDKLSEEEQIARESAQLLNSIERGRGLETRQEIEKVFRDKHLPIDRTA